MRRIVFLAALLLVASTASAQMPQPTLAIEQVQHDPQLGPLQATVVRADFRFDCSAIEFGEARTMEIGVQASSPELYFSGPSTITFDTSPCMRSPQDFIEFDIKFDLKVGEINATSIEWFEIVAVVLPSQQQVSPASNDASIQSTIALIAPEPELDLHAEVQDRAPAEEFAPGPALPLLALGGLAAARLRRP